MTANCLHPGTYMPTKMVVEAGLTPIDSLESGIEATLRVVAGPELAGVTGTYFDRLRKTRAAEQAYESDARRQLRDLTVAWIGAHGAYAGREAT